MAKASGRSISPGVAQGEVLLCPEPIGFYGGVDAKTGMVTDGPLKGESVKGRVLVFPCGKGSTVGSYVIYGLVKNGVGPVALINRETETIVATGAILAGLPCIDKIDIDNLKPGSTVKLDIGEKTGEIEFEE